jgi:mRNA interferase MazF
LKRGEVYWVDFGDPAGVRPAVILTRNAAIELLSSLTVGPLTTRLRRVRSWVFVGDQPDLPQDSCINLDGIQSVHKDAVLDRMFELDPDTMKLVGVAVRFALELDDPPA